MQNQVLEYLLAHLFLSFRFPVELLLYREKLLDLLVHVLLETSHLANNVLDYLRRQLLQHFLLRATKDEGLDSLLQRFQGCQEGLGLFQLLRELLNVRRQILIVLFIEHSLLFQEPRHQEIEYAPQFRHPILQWSATQCQFLFAFNGLDRLSSLCLCVFDDVGLIQDHVEEVKCA